MASAVYGPESAVYAMSFKPRLDILPTPQRLLWDELRQISKQFTLYGKTAIALHLGHRQSVDFDFFATIPINPGNLYSEIPFLKDSKVIQQKNTLSCLVERGDPVMVSFFGLPNITITQPPEICAGKALAMNRARS